MPVPQERPRAHRATPEFADPGYRAAHYGEVGRALKRLAEEHDGETLYRLGRSAGLPWAVVRHLPGAPSRASHSPLATERGDRRYWVRTPKRCGGSGATGVAGAVAAVTP